MSIQKFKDVTYDLSTTGGFLCNTITPITATTGETVSAIEVFNDIVINQSDPARPLTAVNMNATIDNISDELSKKAATSEVNTALNGKVSIVGNGTTTAITADGKSISYAEVGYLDGITSSIQTQLNGKPSISEVLSAVYPIGSIYLSVNSANPSAIFGGTWEQWANGKVPVGVDTSQTEFSTVEKKGGEKSHQLTRQETPRHNHAESIGAYASPDSQGKIVYGNSIDTTDSSSYAWTSGINYRLIAQYVGLSSYGNDQNHNNLQPYITCYMWKRIS